MANEKSSYTFIKSESTSGANIAGAKSSKKRRPVFWYSIAIAIIIIAAAMGFYVYIYLQTNTSPQAASLNTWQLDGMSINYPAGSHTEYSEFNGFNFTSDAGVVSWNWSWSGGSGGLVLSWFACSTTVNTTHALQGAMNELEANATDAAVVSQGYISMAGAIWQFQSFNCTIAGKLMFGTLAVHQDPDLRLYSILFLDDLPNASAALGPLEYYGNTLAISYNWTVPAKLETWQQWGMSIQHPANFSALYEENLNQTANANNGGVRWLWNGNITRLYLVWEAGTSDYNFSRYFQDNLQWYQENYKDVSLLDQGTITMAGATWMYQTDTYMQGSQQFFVTCASAFYQNSQRVYSITFVDTQRDTLSGVEFYGNTFAG